ncbi:DUF2628 domain-containing protein [Rufibacter roseus]|uniref:DUF2628 domain-containing protein n=1 Tax=Rufibacter roseus TaxID=1567108 RepID=A0ABW2DM78_9BACT|nr:DUF2628 domain-containing protein [Rufibacter roseus]
MAEPEEDYTEDYYHAYFGQSADYYLRKLEQYQNGRKFTFNLGAFFFSMLWMLYRKMFIPALVYLGLVIAQGMIIVSLTERSIITKETALYIDRGMTLVWGIVVGFLGNYLYLRQAETKVNRLKRTSLSPQERVDRLHQMGGTTYMPHILLALILLMSVLFNR